MEKLIEASKERFIKPLYNNYSSIFGDNLPTLDELVKFFDTHDNVSKTIQWQNLKGPEAFENLLYAFQNYSSKTKAKKERDVKTQLELDPNFKIIYENDEAVFALVLSYEGAKKADSVSLGGHGAKWCIGYERSDQYWKHYFAKHSLFVLAIRTNGIYDDDDCKYMLRYFPGSEVAEVWNQADKEVLFSNSYRGEVRDFPLFGMYTGNLLPIVEDCARALDIFNDFFVDRTDISIKFGEEIDTSKGQHLTDPNYSKEIRVILDTADVQQTTINGHPALVLDSEKFETTISSLPNSNFELVFTDKYGVVIQSKYLFVRVRSFDIFPKEADFYIKNSIYAEIDLENLSQEDILFGKSKPSGLQTQIAVNNEDELRDAINRKLDIDQNFFKLVSKNKDIRVLDSRLNDDGKEAPIVATLDWCAVPNFGYAKRCYYLGKLESYRSSNRTAQVFSLSKNPRKLETNEKLRKFVWDEGLQKFTIYDPASSLFECVLREAIKAGNVTVHGQRIYQSLNNAGNMYRSRSLPNFDESHVKSVLAKGRMTRMVKIFSLIVLNPGRNRHEIYNAAYGKNGQSNDTYNCMCDYFAWLSGEGYVAVTTKGLYYPTDKGIQKFISFFSIDPKVQEEDVVSYDELCMDQNFTHKTKRRRGFRPY